MTKSFGLAAREAVGDVDDRLPFNFEGTEEQLYAYLPQSGQLVLLLGALNDYAADQERAAVVLDVFWSLLEEETANLLRRRLRDRQDSFGLADVMAIVQWIVEEAAARPTESSLASLPSRATSGHLSTGGAPRKASSRSRSPRPVSAT